MRKFFILLVFIGLPGGSAFSDEWVTGKYAGSFLETGIGARPLSMGGAFVAINEDVTSIFWNPAGLAFLSAFQVHGMHSERFSGIVNWDFIGFGVPLRNKAALGFGYFRLGVDGIPFTELLDSSRDIGEIYEDESGIRIQNIPIATKYVDETEMAFLLSFAKQNSPRFSWGGNVKIIKKNAEDYSAWGIGFDLGIFLNPYKSLKMGVVLVDGTSTLVAWNSGRKELISPHLKFGFAYPFQLSIFQILPAGDIHLRFDNPGSASQLSIKKIGMDFFFGLEVGYKEKVFIRVGNHRGDITAGTGLRFSFLQIDYGYSNHFDLGHSHRVSLTLQWKKGLTLPF